MARATKQPAGDEAGDADGPAADPPVKAGRSAGKGRAVKAAAEAAPPPGLDDAARLAERIRTDLFDAVKELRGVLAEVRAFRDERGDLSRELADLRQQVGAARKEAGEVVKHLYAVRDEAAWALDRVRAGAEAAAGPAADLQRLCQETADRLVKELGGQSVAVGQVVRVREQVEEAVREAAGAGDRIKGFRAECEAAAGQADLLHLKAREAYLQSLAEVLKGLERVKAETTTARERVAAVTPAAARPAPGAVVPPPTPGPPAGAAGNRLGLTVLPVVVVDEVEPESLAADLGLARGDLIEAVDEVEVASGAELGDALAALAGGDLSVRVRRGGHRRDIVTRLGDGSRLGATVAGGLLVAEVIPDGPAAAAGVEPDDVIEKANGREVVRGEELREVVRGLPHDGEAVLTVTRAGQTREVVIRLDKIS